MAVHLTLFKGNNAPWNPPCSRGVNLLLAASHNTAISPVLELVAVFCILPDSCLMELLYCQLN